MELNINQAAEHLGITTTELTLLRARGLPPGTLGYTKPPYDGTVYFDSDDLLPKRAASVPDVEDLVCDECGFVARSASGLTNHQRAHEEEE